MSATPLRVRRAALVLALGLSTTLILGLTPVASADPTEVPALPLPTDVSTQGDYVVTLADAPVAAYDGDVAGYDATQPAEGDSVDVDSGDTKRYRSYLRGRQDDAAARVGAKPRERYEVGLNAFTSRMTGQQAVALRRTDGVISVVKNSLRKLPDDRKSVDFLGLSGSDGVWSRVGGTDDAGRGVVVGVIDSGIWPESKSFAGDPLRKLSSGKKHASWMASSDGRYEPHRVGNRIVMSKSDGGVFRGACETGDDFTADDCNSKLIGARYFGDTWLDKVPPDQRDDYVSPRDGEGHGSHTASIAAGNHGVRAVVDDRDFGTISGVAPAAKIASYKVLWQAAKPENSGAYLADIVAAIEAAIADGVDVINFSISAADDPTSPVSVAFLGAAKAGIFVAASAGNSGPSASTVQSTAPWVTTVGAHTIAPYYATVALGNGDEYAGVSSTVDADDRVGPVPLVNGSAVAAAGQTVAKASVCATSSLDRAKASGKIVVCDRGDVDRLVKSAEVERVGGAGMVLANPTPDTLDADLHSVPTVHVDPPASTKIKAYAATTAATATLIDGNLTDTTIAYPQIANFSARGPSVGTGGDTLKPDLVAPGVSILGAAAPPSNDDQKFAFMSGTSQSAPQVAGLAALWFGSGQEPTWSPMKVKSALMTTATDTTDDAGKKVTDPFAQGAGRVVPERMFSPGLVYPAGAKDWYGYLAGLGQETGSRVKAIDPSNYNSASIAIGRLVDSQTVTRRMTAVKPGLYRVSASLPGVDVRVSPKVLDFKRAGQTQTFEVTFTRTTGAFDKATSGFLTWKSSKTSVRIPMVVTPRLVAAPTVVAGSGGSGEVRFSVRPGGSGAFTSTPTGVSTGRAVGADWPVTVGGVPAMFGVGVAAGTKAARFVVRTEKPAAAVNLVVGRVLTSSTYEVVAESAKPAAVQSLVVSKPVAGTYVVFVEGARYAPDTTTINYVLRSALAQPGTGMGGFAVAPTTEEVKQGRPLKLTATWSGLDDSIPYVGWIEYPNGEGTVVTVN